MIVIETATEDWPPHDWSALAERAALAALAASPQVALLHSAADIEIAVRLTSAAEVRTLHRQDRQLTPTTARSCSATSSSRAKPASAKPQTKAFRSPTMPRIWLCTEYSIC